jgi:hypothetical protein
MENIIGIVIFVMFALVISTYILRKPEQTGLTEPSGAEVSEVVPESAVPVTIEVVGLEKMKKPQLLALAKSHNIPVVSSMKKAEIIAAIMRGE